MPMTLSQRKYERLRQRRRADRRRAAGLCVRCGGNEIDKPRKPGNDTCISCVSYKLVMRKLKPQEGAKCPSMP